MKPEEIGQPHDRLVKHVFSRKETAARFLQAYVPQKLTLFFDWSRLESCPGSFVDPKLRHQESDLLFRIPFYRPQARAGGQFIRGDETFLYCLFEHQTKIDRWMIVCLLAYMVQIWQGLIRSNPKLKRLPPILPLVLYQGPTPWNIALRFEEHLALPKDLVFELGRYQPVFEHLLVDLSQTRAEEIKGDLIGRLALGLMKAVAERKVIAWLEREGRLLGQLLREQKATV